MIYEVEKIGKEEPFKYKVFHYTGKKEYIGTENLPKTAKDFIEMSNVKTLHKGEVPWITFSQKCKMMEDEKIFEKLKKELFLHGYDAIRDFLGFDYSPCLEKDSIENLIDEVYVGMPQDVFEGFYKKYCKN